MLHVSLYATAKGDMAMFKFCKKLLKDESGATAIEYGLIAALVSVAAITALTAMGTSLRTMFTTVSTALATAVGGNGG
jgi:pilus assembly protein Flp/PilA